MKPTTSCDEAREILLDHPLDEVQRRRMTEVLLHVEGCEDCREALRDYDQIRDVLGSFRSDAGPPDGWAAFEERMTQLRFRHRPHPAGRLWLAIAASVLMGGALFLAGRHTVKPAFRLSVVTPPTTGNGTGGEGMGPLLPADLPFAPKDVPHKLTAFDRATKGLDGCATWLVLLANKPYDVGVAQEPVDQSERVLIVQLTLTRQGIEVSNADLLIVPGKEADLKLPLSQGDWLHYKVGTSVDEPMHLSLWLEVQTPQGRGKALALLETNLRAEARRADLCRAACDVGRGVSIEGRVCGSLLGGEEPVKMAFPLIFLLSNQGYWFGGAGRQYNGPLGSPGGAARR